MHALAYAAHPGSASQPISNPGRDPASATGEYSVTGSGSSVAT
jgi:hypothetical protein